MADRAVLQLPPQFQLDSDQLPVPTTNQVYRAFLMADIRLQGLYYARAPQTSHHFHQASSMRLQDSILWRSRRLARHPILKPNLLRPHLRTYLIRTVRPCSRTIDSFLLTHLLRRSSCSVDVEAQSVWLIVQVELVRALASLPPPQ